MIVMKDTKKITNSNELSTIFKALSHPLRVQIVEQLLKDEGTNVSNLVSIFNVSQPTISQHINILKTLGIVTGQRKGSQIYYKINNDTVIKLFKLF